MEIHVQKAYEFGLITEENKYVGVGPWLSLLGKINRKKKKINSRTFSTTAQLSHDKSFSKVMTPKSKVESFCLDEIHDKEELKLLEDIANSTRKAFQQAKLSTLERELLEELGKDPNLQFSAFAKKRGLYPSYVYKVRDRAVKKTQIELEKVLYEL